MSSLPHLDFREERLENGLQVLLYSDRRVPLVHVTLHYRVGASFTKKRGIRDWHTFSNT